MNICNNYLCRIGGRLGVTKKYSKIKNQQGSKLFQCAEVLPNVHKFSEIVYRETIFFGVFEAMLFYIFVANDE